jgi:hypothetical protein
MKVKSVLHKRSFKKLFMLHLRFIYIIFAHLRFSCFTIVSSFCCEVSAQIIAGACFIMFYMFLYVSPACCVRALFQARPPTNRLPFTSTHPVPVSVSLRIWTLTPVGSVGPPFA